MQSFRLENTVFKFRRCRNLQGFWSILQKPINVGKENLMSYIVILLSFIMGVYTGRIIFGTNNTKKFDLNKFNMIKNIFLEAKIPPIKNFPEQENRTKTVLSIQNGVRIFLKP